MRWIKNVLNVFIFCKIGENYRLLYQENKIDYTNSSFLGSSGMAYLSGMCSEEYSCTIAEARSLGSTSLIGQQNYKS